MPTEKKNELSSIFTKLKEALPNYEEREEQKNMATEVLNAIKRDKKLIIEAGTGVGKTFAYLNPSVATSLTLSNGKAAGDLLILENATGNGVTLSDSGNCNLSATRNLYQYDTLTLIWNGSQWLEIKYIDN